MSNEGDILKNFYAAVVKKDLAAARGYLADDLVFVGLFQTYRSADEYIAALTRLLSITLRLDVKKIIAEGNDAAIFFELETSAPAEATVLVAERHQIRNGRISYVESAFDGRPYHAMFTGKAKPGTLQDEQAIRALNDVFAKGFLSKNTRLRASVWTEDGTLVPPQGGFFHGREAIAKHFETEVASVTDTSKMTFSNYRFQFITQDFAFVDAHITINNVLGPDGNLRAVLPVTFVFMAVRRAGKWSIQDGRAHIASMPPAA